MSIADSPSLKYSLKSHDSTAIKRTVSFQHFKHTQGSMGACETACDINF